MCHDWSTSHRRESENNFPSFLWKFAHLGDCYFADSDFMPFPRAVPFTTDSGEHEGGGGGRSYCRLSLLETHFNLKKLSLTRPFFVIIIVLLSSFALLLHMKESKHTQPSMPQIVKMQTELLKGKPEFWWSFIQTNLSEVLTSFDGWGLKVIGRRW